MDRKLIVFTLRGLVAILIAILMFSANSEAKLQKFKKRKANQSAAQVSPDSQDKLFARQADASFVDEFVEPAGYCDSEENLCDSDYASCGSSVGCNRRRVSNRASVRAYVGFEATSLQPRFEQNIAFTTMEGDNGTFESFSDTEFDYDLEFAPRVWLGLDFSDGLGWRITWWEFDHEPAKASANPPLNTFGSINHPTFGGVDISSTTSTDTFSAASGLEAYTIDLEAIKRTSFSSWDLAVGGGIRYAHAEQSYLAQLRDNTNTLRGEIDYRQSIEGIGPTLSLGAYRSLSVSTGFFCNARGSVLFGDGESQLTAGEDLDLSTPFTTTSITNRDDLLSIGDLQVGLRWQSCSNRLHRPFFSLALEGQIWNGAGSATSEDGALGFFGVTSGFGLDW